MHLKLAGRTIGNRKRNRYDYVIILTIVSVIVGGEAFGAFTPIRLIGFVASFYFIFLFRKWREYFFIRNGKTTVFLFIFLIYAITSAMWIADVKEYFIATLSLYCYVFDFLLILYAVQRAKTPTNSIILGWIIFLILNLLCASWEISTGEHFTTGSFQAEETMTGGIRRIYAAVTYGNYNSFCIVLCLTLMFLLLYMHLNQGFKHQLFAILMFFCVCTVLVVNTSRGALLCLMLFLIPLWYVIRKHRRVKYIVIFTLLGVGCYLWIECSDIILFLIDQKLSARSGGAGNDPRWTLWKAGLNIASQWLYLGAGAGSMIYEYTREHVFILYAHNLWIQLLVEYGFLITGLFICFYIKSVFSALRSDDPLLKILGLYLLICWPILTIIDEGYMKAFNWIFFASVYSFLYCCKHLQPNE